MIMLIIYIILISNALSGAGGQPGLQSINQSKLSSECAYGWYLQVCSLSI